MIDNIDNTIGWTYYMSKQRLYMLVEDWQGAEVYEVEPISEVFLYWPFGGNA